MKWNPFVKVTALIGFLVLLTTALFAQNSVKLSTYYPAPFGAYDRLKLVPRPSLPAEPNCDDAKDLGTMYYDDGKGELPEGVYICQRVGEEVVAWVPMGQRYY